MRHVAKSTNSTLIEHLIISYFELHCICFAVVRTFQNLIVLLLWVS